MPRRGGPARTEWTSFFRRQQLRRTLQPIEHCLLDAGELPHGGSPLLGQSRGSFQLELHRGLSVHAGKVVRLPIARRSHFCASAHRQAPRRASASGCAPGPADHGVGFVGPRLQASVEIVEGHSGGIAHQVGPAALAQDIGVVRRLGQGQRVHFDGPHGLPRLSVHQAAGIIHVGRHGPGRLEIRVERSPASSSRSSCSKVSAR